MGQKTNPIAIRLQLEKNWNSKWITGRDFANYLYEDLRLKEAVNKFLGRQASINRIEIKRDAREISLTIYTAKPGIIIGRSGQGISNLQKHLQKIIAEVSKRMKTKPKNLTKLKIEIIEIREPESCARLMAQNIATQLEKRIAYRRAVKQSITRIRQNRNNLGVKVNVAGRLGGVEIARRERFSDGSIPLGTFKANIDYAQENAYTTYGVIGVKVWIYKRDQAVKK